VSATLPLPAAPAPRLVPDPPAATAVPWVRTYAHTLVVLDLLVLAVSGLFAVWARFGGGVANVRGVSYYAAAAVVVALWMASLALGRSYEPRFLGNGTEEFKRVGNASVRLAAAVALVCYGAQIDLARGFVAVVLPTGLLLLLLERLAARQWLRRARQSGRCSHRVVIVGAVGPVRDLARQLGRDPLAGLHVVGVCVPGLHGDLEVEPDVRLPIIGSLALVRQALVAARADTVAVTASPGITGEGLRRLSYELEGTGVDLLVAPALTNVAGSRVSIRPVAGAPLLHVDEPELGGSRKFIKELFDRTVALVGLVLLSPLLLLLAVLVRLTSAGPAFFRQQRVGRDGDLFVVWKFRSMYHDAEQRRSLLEELNESAGVLFKIRDDPRVTRVGRVLRKYSVDELPQLFNVLLGQMSLVGPRPPLPSEVERYEGHAHRRLLVKPGITGLWQVSGRSDLSWEDTVRLDLYYVENWSLGLDLAVLARTALTVFRGSGAY